MTALSPGRVPDGAATSDPPDLYATALELYRAGFSVVPVRSDGTKRPACAWKPYQGECAEPQQLRVWFGGTKVAGIGVVTGAVSGNLEMLEFEGRAVGLIEQLEESMRARGHEDLWKRVSSGWVEKSPSGGRHWFFRVDGPALQNTKLAQRSPQSGTTPEVLVETRGEGGYVIAAPSHGATHSTGNPWTRVTGGPHHLPTLTTAERDVLYDIARTLDQGPKTESTAATPATVASPVGERPGDDFNRRATWDEILSPVGWVRSPGYQGEACGWTRPGKDPAAGISATTGFKGTSNLFVFSTSTVFEAEKPYDKFSAYAQLHHGGDFKAAARALSAKGYGNRSSSRRRTKAIALDDGPGVSPDAGADPTPHLTRLSLDVGNAAESADWLKDNVGRGRLSGMFLRGRQVVHTPCEGETGYEHLSVYGDDGPAQVRVVDKSILASRIQYTYDCYRWHKGDQVAAMFPLSAARVATDVPEELPYLRRLDGVVHTPVLRSDGTVLAAPGYDDATRLMYLPLGLVVPQVADAPSVQEVAAAVALLDQMTAGFKFVTADDRANYYGLLLTPLLRGLTPPPYKMAAISSPQPGSGKTLLAGVARKLHGGVFRAEMPEDDRELRKQITALLTVTTGPLVHLDNVSGTLRSSTMSGLLTSATWGDRPLGVTDWVETPNDRIWVITGNNVHLGGDLPRRTLWISIDPGVPNPERRTGFTIMDLERWVEERRGELLHALLTLARAWVAAGRPAHAAATSDGYSKWIDTVASILSHAGVPGIFGASPLGPEFLGADDEDWAEMLSALHETFGTEPWSVKELLDRIDVDHQPAPTGEYSRCPTTGRPTIPLTSLPAHLQAKLRQDGKSSIARQLGSWISRNKGRWAGGYTARFVREGRSRERFWGIDSAEVSAADPGE